MICNFICSMFSSSTDVMPDIADSSSPVFNPATGLPMLGDSIGGVDVGGSPYGTDIHNSTSGGLGVNPWE